MSHSIEQVVIHCESFDVSQGSTSKPHLRGDHSVLVPDVSIKLIKDTAAGDFHTQEIEVRWRVSVVDTGGRQSGWGFSKQEPLFFNSKEKFLIVDSDTVFTGPVLDTLASYDASFIVDNEPQPADEVKRYYDIQALSAIDPKSHPYGKNFNSGQWVGASGLSRRENFNEVVERHNTPRPPKMFMAGDQGVLNYVLEKLPNSGRIQLAKAPLMWWALQDLNDFKVSSKVERKALTTELFTGQVAGFTVVSLCQGPTFCVSSNDTITVACEANQ